MLAALTGTQPLAAQNYLKDALAAQTNGPVYSYQLQYMSPEFRATARVNPSRARGQRITVLSPAKSEWGKDEKRALADVDKDAGKAFWCHSFAKRIPYQSAKLISQTDKTATYRFVPLPEPGDADDAKIMRNLVGSVVVHKTKPAILKFGLKAPKSFKPAFIARIKTFVLSASCARTADGRTYVSRFELNVSGSAMMQKFTEKETRIHSRLKRAVN